MQKTNTSFALAARAIAQAEATTPPSAILANHGGNVEAPTPVGVSTGFVARFIEEEFLLDEFMAASIADATDSIGDAVQMAFVVARELAPQRVADLDDIVEPQTSEARVYQALTEAAQALPHFTVGELNLRLAAFRVDVFGAGPGAYLTLADAVRTGEVQPREAWRMLIGEQKPPLIVA